MLQIIESVKRGARGHPSQWTSYLATDQNCLLKKTDSWCPSENNYVHISGGRPWESLCTLAARTLGPETNCLHQTLESPPKANPASAWTWGEAAHITHPKRLVLLLFLQLFQDLDWDRPGLKSCYTLHLWLCAKWLRTLSLFPHLWNGDSLYGITQQCLTQCLILCPIN